MTDLKIISRFCAILSAIGCMCDSVIHLSFGSQSFGWKLHLCQMPYSVRRRNNLITHWGIDILFVFFASSVIFSAIFTVILSTFDEKTPRCVTWLLYTWYECVICWTWLIHTWDNSFVCDMTHSYVTWLIHMWHDSFICDMTHSYVTWLNYMWRDSIICDVTHSYVTWLVHMWHGSFTCDMTDSYET